MRQPRVVLLNLFSHLALQFHFLLSTPRAADPGFPLPLPRSTCTFAAIAAQMNNATSFGSFSLCPFMLLTHGSVSCSSPMTNTMFTLAQCGTAMKVRRAQTQWGRWEVSTMRELLLLVRNEEKHLHRLLRCSLMRCLTG